MPRLYLIDNKDLKVKAFGDNKEDIIRFFFVKGFKVDANQIRRALSKGTLIHGYYITDEDKIDIFNILLKESFNITAL